MWYLLLSINFNITEADISPMQTMLPVVISLFTDKNNVTHVLNNVFVKGYTNTYTFINAKLKL